MTKIIGYHVNCGGKIRLQTQRKCSGNYTYEFHQCKTCGAPIHPPHAVTQDRPVYPRQKTAGVKRRRPRYDIKSWRDVKP